MLRIALIPRPLHPVAKGDACEYQDGPLAAVEMQRARRLVRVDGASVFRIVETAAQGQSEGSDEIALVDGTPRQRDAFTSPDD